MSKYHARRVVNEHGSFASMAEYARYQMLMLQQSAGDIRNLKLHPRFDIIIDGMHVCYYEADYEYDLVSTGAHIVEDCKGVKTPVYRLKKKLVKAMFDIDILESNADGIPFS